MWSLLVNALLKYISSHPEVLENLIEQGVQALINAIKSHNAGQAAALPTTTVAPTAAFKV